MYGNLAMHNCDVHIISVTFILRRTRNLMMSKWNEVRTISDLKCTTSKETDFELEKSFKHFRCSKHSHSFNAALHAMPYYNAVCHWRWHINLRWLGPSHCTYCTQQQHRDLPVRQEYWPRILELKTVDWTQTHLNDSCTHKWSDSVFTVDHLHAN